LDPPWMRSRQYRRSLRPNSHIHGLPPRITPGYRPGLTFYTTSLGCKWAKLSATDPS